MTTFLAPTPTPTPTPTPPPTPRHAASHTPDLRVRWRGMPADRPVLPKRSRRDSTLVVSVATAVGLWLGLTAPTVSPVAPPPPAAVTASIVPGSGQ